MNNFRKTGIICLTVGAVLVIAALLLFVQNRIGDRHAGESVKQMMPEIREFITAKAEERGQTEDTAETENTGESDTNAEIAESETEHRMTVEEIAGYEYIGILMIPSLDLELPVMDECTDENLLLAPCRYYGSLEIDNLVIAGHNYKQHFGNLSLIEVGDAVTFTAMDGTEYEYRVGLVETLDITAVDEMNNSEWDLSLYTCTYTGRERITVRCERTGD